MLRLEVQGMSENCVFLNYYFVLIYIPMLRLLSYVKFDKISVAKPTKQI